MMMREEEEGGRWSARWEEEEEEEEELLPSPEELMPLSQTLITPDLALAFDIPTPSPPHPADLDSAGTGGVCGGGGDEPARTLKRPRLVWTPQLHKRFVDAVAHLGIKNAVPKTIMQLMGVDGLTRENVASHLQKYRLYLKRMQQGLLGSSSSGPDAATDRLFASSPIPHHFLRGGLGGPPEGPAFAPVPALHHHHHHHHHQMVQQQQQQQQQQFYHQRQQQQQQMGHFGFDHGFLARGQPQPQPHRMVPPASYVDDSEEGSGGGRRVLTLFPTGED